MGALRADFLHPFVLTFKTEKKTTVGISLAATPIFLRQKHWSIVEFQYTVKLNVHKM